MSIPELTQFDFEEKASGEDINGIGPTAKSCKIGKFNYELDKSVNFLGGKLIPTNYAVPCGFFPANYPQGNLQITNTDTNEIIGFESNDLVLFQEGFSTNFNPVKQWADLTDRKFKSWMEANAQLGILKYWGNLNTSISGKFTFELRVNNPLPP